jgi:hypothetical protein
MTRRSNPAAPSHASAAAPRFYDRSFDDRRHDPYEPRGKLGEPSVCRDCGAVYRQGRWQWTEASADAAPARCSACRRIADRMPAGSVVLEGPFVAEHRAEVLQLARNEAAQEEALHPANRLMYVDETAERVTIACTDIHLPQRIGKALQRAYKGEVAIRFGEDEYSVRVVWQH